MSDNTGNPLENHCENLSEQSTDYPLRGNRSFARYRSGASRAQQRALAELLPVWGVPYQNTPMDLNRVFARDNPKILEIGFGMGQASAEIAQKLPQYDFLAADVYTPGVGSLLKLIDEKQLSNIRVMHHDAVEILRDMLADNALFGVHIFFPDPWHKKRHHKRRLIQQPFLDLLLPKIRAGGYLHLATDWEEYAVQMLDALRRRAELRNTAADYAEKPAYRPATKFENRGRKLGHGVWDLVFEKR